MSQYPIGSVRGSPFALGCDFKHPPPPIFTPRDGKYSAHYFRNLMGDDDVSCFVSACIFLALFFHIFGQSEGRSVLLNIVGMVSPAMKCRSLDGSAVVEKPL